MIFRRNILIRLCLLPIIFFVLIEAYFQLREFPMSWSSIYKFDEELGYQMRPGVHRFPILSEVFHLEVDSEGVVDRYGKGKPGLLILGDGVVAGIEHDKEKRLANLVAQYTDKTVVNLSVPGYGTVQQLISLERWIHKNGSPKQVVLIYNSTNDYFDNVQQWESTQVPGVIWFEGEHRYIYPDNPNVIGRLLREVIWHSTVIEVLRNWWSTRNNMPSKSLGIPLQQKWLFSNVPPNESKPGDIATQVAFAELLRLSKKHKFDFNILIWRDVAIEELDSLEIDNVVNRLNRLTGIDKHNLGIISLPIRKDYVQWERDWLYPGTRHASEHALRRIAGIIGNQGEMLCR